MLKKCHVFLSFQFHMSSKTFNYQRFFFFKFFAEEKISFAQIFKFMTGWNFFKTQFSTLELEEARHEERRR